MITDRRIPSVFIRVIRGCICLSLCLGVSSAAGGDTPVRGAITALAFSADGKKLAVGMARQALIYDPATWQPVSTFTQVQNTVRALTFHPDGKRLAVCSGIPGKSGDLILWDTTTPDSVRKFSPEKDTIEAVAFGKSGETLLGSNDSRAHFYPQANVGAGPILDEHNGRVLAVAISPKEKYIFITGAMDKVVKVWEETKPQVVVNFDQATAGITGLAFLPNGDQFVGSSMDGNLYWWGVSYDAKKRVFSGYHFRTVGAHTDGVLCLSMSAGGQRFITGGMDHRVAVWNLDGGQIRAFSDPKLPIYAVAISPDGKTAAGAGREGLIYIWDVEANRLAAVIAPPAAPPVDVAEASRK